MLDGAGRESTCSRKASAISWPVAPPPSDSTATKSTTARSVLVLRKSPDRCRSRDFAQVRLQLTHRLGPKNALASEKTRAVWNGRSRPGSPAIG